MTIRLLLCRDYFILFLLNTGLAQSTVILEFIYSKQIIGSKTKLGNTV